MGTVLKQKISNRIVLGKALINEANIGKNVEVIVQEGAIFILPAVKPKGWELLKTLGEDAGVGVLENPSERHDDYLYGARR